MKNIYVRFQAYSVQMLLLALILHPSLTFSQTILPENETATKKPPLVLKNLNNIECPDATATTKSYQKKFTQPIQKWAKENLSSLQTKKVTYLFSGADVATVFSLFSEANHYTLIADQNPEFSSLNQVSTRRAAQECQTHTYFSKYGYYRTNDLEGKNSIKPRFTQLLGYSIALIGAQILSKEYIYVTQDGTTQVRDSISNSNPDGLRIKINTSDNRTVYIDYIRINLSNNGLEKSPQFIALLKNQTSDTIFIKSASHLLQKSYFSVLGDLITSNTRNIVQDETGLDITDLSKYFSINVYGKDFSPHPIWKNSPSALRLKKYLAEEKSFKELPFTIGYEKKSGSILLIGQRK